MRECVEVSGACPEDEHRRGKAARVSVELRSVCEVREGDRQTEWRPSEVLSVIFLAATPQSSN